MVIVREFGVADRGAALEWVRSGGLSLLPDPFRAGSSSPADAWISSSLRYGSDPVPVLLIADDPEALRRLAWGCGVFLRLRTTYRWGFPFVPLLRRPLLRARNLARDRYGGEWWAGRMACYLTGAYPRYVSAFPEAEWHGDQVRHERRRWGQRTGCCWSLVIDPQYQNNRMDDRSVLPPGLLAELASEPGAVVHVPAKSHRVGLDGFYGVPGVVDAVGYRCCVDALSSLGRAVLAGRETCGWWGWVRDRVERLNRLRGGEWRLQLQ